ncbi:MAG: radical SAM protein [Lachnospira sp.]
MKAGIFGAGEAGKFLYDEIKNNNCNIEVLGFIDNKVTGYIDGISVLRPDIFFNQNKKIVDAVFIAAGAQKTVTLFVECIRNYSDCDIYMLHDIAGKCRLTPFNSDGSIKSNRLRKIIFGEDKPTLPYFEVPITDKCNLNCKGCLFACNGINEYDNISYGQIEKDAKRMSELFKDIPWIRILGGEPLLHPDLEKILKMYRETFPDSEIDLCTNGLLIPKSGQDFFNCLKDNRITIHVSGYKPTYKILDKIDALLKENGIEYTILKREQFAKYYTITPTNDSVHNFEECFASRCRELYNGKLLRCSAVIAFDKLNDKYGTNYVTCEDEDWFDIYKADADGWSIKEKLDQASNICRYCNIDNTELFDWDYADRGEGLKDYLVNER